MEGTKVIIFAGGSGTRLREETEYKPKPMVTIGKIPILIHIMKIYSYYGFNDFIIALGYKGDVIKDYFLKYYAMNNDFTIDLKDNKIEYLNEKKENFKVTLVDTGQDTMTGGRLKRLQKYIGNNVFMATYGDGVADINITELFKFHKKQGKTATITGVKPSSRFGELNVKENLVIDFQEKPQMSNNYINGGFFVFEPGFFDYLKGDDSLILEKEPFEKVSKDGNLMIYRHEGFWKSVDTYKDFLDLNKLWEEGAPWEVWRKKSGRT